MLTNELRRIADVIDRVLGADADRLVASVHFDSGYVHLMPEGIPVLDRLGATRSHWYGPFDPRLTHEQREVRVEIDGVRFYGFERRPVAQPEPVPA